MTQRDKKILVIVDTNRLGNYSKDNLLCKNYSYLEINKHLHENVVNNFSFKKSKNTIIQVAIPEIVLEELKQQQNKSFEHNKEKIIEDFRKFESLSGSELKIPSLDYESYLSEKATAYLGVYNIKKIENPPDNILVKLINKVIKRKKPFYKRNRNIDSGFKDAIIWESILNFVSKNTYDRYFFLTGDNDFNDPLLKKEFSNIAKQELFIFNEIADLKGRLEEEIKGTDQINKALQKIESNLLDTLNLFIRNNYSEYLSGGNFYDIKNIADYSILDINSSDGKYLVSIVVYLEHESIYAVHAKFGAFDQAYINDTEFNPAEISLIFDSDYSVKEISSEEVLFNGRHKIGFKK